jgi:hypothetical protein
VSMKSKQVAKWFPFLNEWAGLNEQQVLYDSLGDATSFDSTELEPNF